MKKFGILVACLFVSAGFSTDGFAAKKHRHRAILSGSVEPQGAERQRQFVLVTKECQKKWGSMYTAIHAQWMRAEGKHGWFCTNQ